MPYNDTKEVVSVEFVSIEPASKATEIAKDTVRKGSKVTREVMAYVNRHRTEPGQPWKEYVGKINKGVVDGIARGVPEEYFEKYIRPFIPPPSDEEGEPEIRDSIDRQLADTLRFALHAALNPVAPR